MPTFLCAIEDRKKDPGPAARPRKTYSGTKTPSGISWDHDVAPPLPTHHNVVDDVAEGDPTLPIPLDDASVDSPAGMAECVESYAQPPGTLGPNELIRSGLRTSA